MAQSAYSSEARSRYDAKLAICLAGKPSFVYRLDTQRAGMYQDRSTLGCRTTKVRSAGRWLDARGGMPAQKTLRSTFLRTAKAAERPVANHYVMRFGNWT